MSESCPTCGSTDRDVLEDGCAIPAGISDRHIPADEVADPWHFEEGEMTG